MQGNHYDIQDVLTDRSALGGKSIFLVGKGPINCMGPKWCYSATWSKVALQNITETRTFLSTMKGWDLVTKLAPNAPDSAGRQFC